MFFILELGFLRLFLVSDLIIMKLSLFMEYMKKKLLSLQTISSEGRIMAILLPDFKVMKYTKPDVAKKISNAAFRTFQSLTKTCIRPIIKQ
jgi:hypothetical protein